jgi:hypothetical protein
MIHEIQRLLNEKYNISTTVEYGIINGDNGYIKIQITPPIGAQPPYRTTWRLRMHPSESFEGWGSPAAICEEFDDEHMMAEYLSNVTDVYKTLFQHLSHDHKKVKGERDRRKIRWL